MTSRQPSSVGQSVITKHSDTKRHSIPKRKEKEGSEVEVKDKLRAVELEKFCPQKIFNVLFINETDKNSDEMIKKIIEMSKEFEDISYLIFITYEEVISLAKNCENAILPPLIKLLLKSVSMRVNDNLQDEETVSMDLLAQLMKLKLIEVMYTNYVKAVKKMQQRRKLITDLKMLADECRQDRYKEKSSKRADSRTNISKSDLTKKNKMQDNKEIVDYTTVPLQTDDDIVFDDDIHHHISFYIFSGFYDPELLKELIINNNVPIQSILKFTAQNADEEPDHDWLSIYSNFWDSISKYFDGPEREEFSENTFLMTYSATGGNLKRIFEELLYVIRNISDIKMQHLNYIRHMEIFRDKEVYNFFPLECLTVYNNFLQKIPFELVNIPILLDCLLKQVCVSVDETLTFSENISQHSYLEFNSFEKKRCINPCSIEAFFKRKAKVRSEPSILKKLETSFRAYENDELVLILNSYKKYGPIAYDITTKMLKHVKPLKDLDECEMNYTEIIHKHDRDPSAKTIIQNKDAIFHFLYLFLFSCFGYKNVLPKMADNEILKNLEAYHKLDFINLSQPKIIKSDDVNDDEEEVIQGNLYNTAVTEYFWKETLEPTVLLQEIYKAHNKYLYCDQRYSPETDTLLIQFSDGLDEFGINTKIYDQPLLTTVCLRDFCRYDIVQQSEWLEKHKPPRHVRKCLVNEQCQGAQKLTSWNLFPEYRHLLETGIQKSPETDRDPVTNVDYEDITFEHLVNEIKYYPSNTKIIKECTKSGEQGFLVYDLGTKYFHVKGAKTRFVSHDGVMMSVDNTRMLEEYPKCSVTLSCRNNSLILHSGKFYATHDYNFHMNLADGTIISYVFFKHKKAKHPKTHKKEIHTVPHTGTVDLTLDADRTSDIEYEEKVRSVDKDYFESVIKTRLLNEEFDGSEEIVFKPSESMLERLKAAATTNVPIYKVNSNLTYLKKVKSEFEIPLSHIIKRVLHTTIQKEEMQSFTKRYLPVDERSHDSDKIFDARIALPNGLYISFYPSQLKKGYLEVKQEFLSHNSSTEEEEFRLFTRGGYSLVKRIDGCITTLKSNGDIIKHEKLDTNSEDVNNWYTGPCHCKTTQDYIKRANKMLKYANDEVSIFAASRRAHLRTRKGSVAANPYTIDMLTNNKIPYLKNTSLKFDGNRVCLQSGKVKVKKLLHTSCENNFRDQEIYLERSDGFKSTLDKNGSQMIEFVNGTRITSSVHVSRNLVDGYVYISLEFKFEHPNYATVVYTFDSDLEIHLNHNVVVKVDLESSSLRIDEDIVTTVDKRKVFFEKTCAVCNSKYTCDINIKPLVKEKTSFSGKFVDALDSYNKHFYSDFAGNCKRNEDYKKGQFNSVNCNHFSCRSYKKLFVVNRSLSGERFWTDNMVLTKKRAISRDAHSTLKDYNDMANPKIHVYKFERQIFDHYSSRFLKTNPLDKKDVIYSTFRVVKRMIDEDTLQKFCQDLTEFFSRPENINIKYCNVLDQMVKGYEMYYQRDNETVVETKQVAVQVEKCKCVQEKITMSEKIENWKRECQKYRTLLRTKIPCYFDSQFCKTIKKQ